MRGSLGTSIEEGPIRSIAADAVSDNSTAHYDQTLARSSAIGMLDNQILQRFSLAAVVGSANSVLNVLHRKFWRPYSLLAFAHCWYALGSRIH